MTFLVFVRDYLRWARPWVHVAKAAISQPVRIARLKSAVLAVPVRLTFAVYYCAPGSIAKSSAGRSSKRCRRCKSSDTKYQFRRGFQHDERSLPGPHVNTRRGSNATSIPAQQVGQLSNVRGNPPRLILCEQLGRYCKHLGTTNATRLFFRWGKSAWRRS